MRGKISDSDLTNYALNDGLDSRERLYVESMLAVSEECRNDVYQMIELGQMLDEGFEKESAVLPRLTAEQREALLHPRPDRSVALAFLNRAVATLAVAACVAFALVHTQMWRAEAGAGSTVAQVTSQMTELGKRAAAATEEIDFSTFVDLQILSEDSSDWLQAASDAADSVMQPATICTPPTLLDPSDFTDIN